MVTVLNSRSPHTHLAAFKACFALCCLLVFSHAQAANSICVNDKDKLQLALALTIAQSQPYTITIAEGYYSLDGDIDYENIPYPITLRGGYKSDCSSLVAKVNPENTVINIGQGHHFILQQPAGSPEAQLNIEGLTFANTDMGIFMDAGTYHLVAADDEGSLNLTNVRFTGLSHADGGPTLNLGAINNEVNLNNILIDHITTSDSCAVFLWSQGGANIHINHMTADLSGGRNFCLYNSNSTTIDEVYNSILWGSDGSTPFFTADSASSVRVDLINDVFHGVSNNGHELHTDNQINMDPGWINAAAGDYHLQFNGNPLSPSINSGTTQTPGGEPDSDIEGNARITGSAPDRGAYESPYNGQTVLTVRNTNDSGPDSLRQAVIDANAPPLNVPKSIVFDIRDVNHLPICPAQIALSSALPDIAVKLNINGYTQLSSTSNTNADTFNAKLCVLLQPSGAVSSALRVPFFADTSVSLTVRGLGFGGFGQPIILLGGSDHVIAGNQFGGSANGVALTGAGLSAISIGVDVSGKLIVGGDSIADRNVIGGATNGNGINIQGSVQSSTNNCQIVNNLIGLAPDGNTALANAIGINAAGSGCLIDRNRVTGNTSENILLNGDKNVVIRNQIGITAQNGSLSGSNNSIGILVLGSNNIIGASGVGGAFNANTIRFMGSGGVVIQSNASGNSVNANLIYDNFAGIFPAMDIDLIASGNGAGPNANDGLGDGDTGPNDLQNFPIAKSISYTGAGSGPNGTINRPATLKGVLDTAPDTYRIDAYYSNDIDANTGRGHAEVYLGHTTVTLTLVGGPGPFSLPITVPGQPLGAGISLTATNSAGSTSEIGTALPIDTIFIDGLERGS